MSRRGGRASSRMTQLVLETYGRQCHLRLPGCKGVATTKDHIIPYAHGGDDSLENFRPACRPCNSKRQDRVRTGYGASVVIVCGPPAAGKTTYVLEHAKPSDVTIDLDTIAHALMPQDPAASSHEYPDHVRRVAIAARRSAIRVATRLQERITVWVVQSIPSPDDLVEYRGLGWQLVTIDPGRAVVERRVRALRPAEMQRVVDRWYAQPHLETNASTPSSPALVSSSSSGADW